jgi:transposase
MSIELGSKDWKLAFTAGDKVRRVSVPYGARAALLVKIADAKKKLGVSPDGRVQSCYEAGRDGFWIHRWLVGEGINNLVVDSASIEVNRRSRRAKTDRLDARKLVLMLFRYDQLNEKTLWRVVKVPSKSDEDARRPDRELARLKKESTAHRTRMKALLVTQGLKVSNVMRLCIPELRDWRGEALEKGLSEELLREQQRLGQVIEQIAQLEDAQEQGIKEPQTHADRVAHKLYGLRSVGPVSSSSLSREFFAWRDFKNVRQVGALAGLTGTPYNSGESIREQGISKAGNARIRTLAIELAWRWIRYQPESELTQWFNERFAEGGTRMRRIGIVAVARKLLVALWKYLEHDELPAGAVLKA